MVKEKPDVIICAGFSFATLTALFYKFIFSGNYIIWNEGTYITEEKRSKLRILTRKLMARCASGFVDAGTLSQKYLESLLPQKHNKKFFRSYNCVDNEKFGQETRPDMKVLDEFRKRFPPHNILFVGQLVERKGIIQLLDVYKKVINNYGEKVGLILVGQGPLQNYVTEFKEKYFLQNIFLEGFVKYEDIPKYYWISDLFALLSIEDPNPLVIFEALSAGIPILCSNQAGNAIDSIIDGENGFVVDPNKIEEVALRAIQILDWNEAKKKEAGMISRELVKRANYSDSAKAFIDACKYVLIKKGFSGCDRSVSPYQNI
jgi:glycosyltransferase involved in cell wall biosynthesis